MIVVVYYGLTLSITNLSGNVFTNFAISACMETLAYVITLVLLDRVGRKPLLTASMLVSGFSCTASIVPVLLNAPGGLLSLSSVHLYCQHCARVHLHCQHCARPSGVPGGLLSLSSVHLYCQHCARVHLHCQHCARPSGVPGGLLSLSVFTSTASIVPGLLDVPGGLLSLSVFTCMSLSVFTCTVSSMPAYMEATASFVDVVVVFLFR